MLMVTHASITGAAGEFLGNPWIAFPLGIAIHLGMDKIPHFWPAERKGKGIVIIVDTILSVIFIASLFLVPTDHQAGLVWGAVAGVIVDVVLVGIFRAKGKIPEWHTKRQPHKTEYLWLATDIFVFLLGVTLIWLLR